MSHEELHTMVMQTSWVVIEVYYGIVQVVNSETQVMLKFGIRAIDLGTLGDAY